MNTLIFDFKATERNFERVRSFLLRNTCRQCLPSKLALNLKVYTFYNLENASRACGIGITGTSRETPGFRKLLAMRVYTWKDYLDPSFAIVRWWHSDRKAKRRSRKRCVIIIAFFENHPTIIVVMQFHGYTFQTAAFVIHQSASKLQYFWSRISAPNFNKKFFLKRLWSIAYAKAIFIFFHESLYLWRIINGKIREEYHYHIIYAKKIREILFRFSV